ncbi:gustatory receptor 5a for trehalose-like [Ceratitis capitata]|uniref:gustatory receptor 5a for trehalose-like n=1 Tax=Ceratitis capitata TaxID=7213 RepID=UPI000A10FCD1|nr:gustatory receptor 5a for trehalose-like [Ceratitis capitata]
MDIQPSTHKQPTKQTRSKLGEKLEKGQEGNDSLSRRKGKTRGVRRGTRADYLHNGSFHESVGPVLVIAQWFGLMPVRGILAVNAKSLKFSWVSFRTCYSVVYVILTSIDTGLTMNMVFRGAMEVKNISPLVFHVNALLVAICFLRLAVKWPQLMLKWQRVERQLPPHQMWRDREALALRVHKVTFVLITLALTEHLLSVVSGIHFAIHCSPNSDPIKSFFIAVSPHTFLIFNYSTWLAWCGKLLNVLNTFGWSYMDVFLMIIGLGLSSLFGQVQNSLNRVKGKTMPEAYWTRTRLQYRLICDLIEQVDGVVSGMIMLSFANNLFFVCIQLLKSINKMPSISHFVYFYASLSFLLGRTLAVSLYLSEVNDRSREPLLVIKHVPREGYCAEIERFGHEVAVDKVALTGMQFFNITRGLVLAVAGTIVTYELVLIQFHEEENLWACN